ncbi:lipid A deacylase LpxR family protein [Brumimicrobium mesophilum]|uniref:lipid A deacylase LpxR family protein n=1 Tax=Brumimicrobium mesophilum TaxID=392717 RepID=UPI000D144E29|nr:lipid A deacylase LpxR family protein [Brumimicrobium mesophilum]
MTHLFILILFTILSIPAIFAQKIDNLSSFNDTGSDHYLRFHYDNDLFNGLDKDYTQGFILELVAPILKKNPVNYLFFNPKSDEVRYGMAIEHNSFTPDRYFVPEIQFGDRPFASTLSLKSFMISVLSANASRFTSSFSLGMIGPAALGEEIQAGIHKVTNSATPRGWGNQIQNDLVLNYEIAYEKRLMRFRNLFSIQAEANAKIGSIYTNATIGMNTSVGILNNAFSVLKSSRNFNLYLFFQPLIHVIGYDATLQGGLFNEDSPYTISSGDIERFTGQLNYGVVLKTKSFYLEYSGSVITKEFKTGTSAKWGGVTLGSFL